MEPSDEDLSAPCPECGYEGDWTEVGDLFVCPECGFHHEE